MSDGGAAEYKYALSMQELLDRVDWPNVMAMPRYAGGHHEVMHAMFKDAKVFAEYFEDDYQGNLGIVWLLDDGHVIVQSDYFGSCSGCDSWEDTTDAEAKTMIHALASTAKSFHDLGRAVLWLENEATSGAEYYGMADVAPHLSRAIRDALLAAGIYTQPTVVDSAYNAIDDIPL